MLRVILGRAAGDLGQRDFAVAETRQTLLDQLVRGKLGGNVDYRVPVCRELVGLLECQCRLALARGGPDCVVEPGVDTAEDAVECVESEGGDGFVFLKGVDVLVEHIKLEDEGIDVRTLHYSLAPSASLWK